MAQGSEGGARVGGTLIEDKWDRKKHPQVDPWLLESMLDSEYRAVQSLLANPREDPQQDAYLRNAVTDLRHSFGNTLNFIAEYLDQPWMPAPRAALSAVQAGRIDGPYLASVYDEAKQQPKPAPSKSEEPVDSSQPTPPPYWASVTVPFVHSKLPGEGRARIKFQFRRARTLAGIGSILIVSLAGLKLQYLDEQGFNGSLSAWIGLLLWAAVVELSGVSVLDVLGRLGTSGARVRATSS